MYKKKSFSWNDSCFRFCFSIQLVASSKGWATNPASFCFSLNHLLWWKHLIIVTIILMLVLIQPQTLICIYTYVMKNMLRMLPHKCPLLYSKPSWFYPLNYSVFSFSFSFPVSQGKNLGLFMTLLFPLQVQFFMAGSFGPLPPNSLCIILSDSSSLKFWSYCFSAQILQWFPLPVPSLV